MAEKENIMIHTAGKQMQQTIFYQDNGLWREVHL